METKIRKGIFLALTPILAGGVLFLACAGLAAEKTYNIKFAIIYPTDSPSAKAEHGHFIDRVAELSNGRILVKMYGPGTLGTPPEYPQLVRDGIADMALLFNPYYGDINPLAEAISLPFVAKTYAQAVQVTRQLYETAPGIKAFLDEYNMEGLWYCAGSSPTFQLIKPAKSLEEIKGLKLRTSGGTFTYLVKAWGIVPVYMPPGDVYPALRAGVVDGGFNPLFYQMLFKWYEVAPHFIIPSHVISTPASAIVMNIGVWNKMSKADKDIMIKAGLEQEAITVDKWTKEYRSLPELMKKKGCTIVWMSESETEELVKLSESAVQAWIKDNSGGKAIIDRIKGIVEKLPAK